MNRIFKVVHTVVLTVICSFDSFVFAQEASDSLTTLHLHEVVVTATQPNKETIPVQTLTGDELSKLNSNSVADALRYFAGVQVKDYGGVGGIKTVNIRSMGTNHTGVVYDGVEN